MLFLGNSYIFTNSLDDVVADLYDGAGTPLATVTRLAEGGYTLPDHVAQVETPGSDWAVAFAQPQADVVLQDQSQIPGFPEDEPYFIASVDAAVTLDGYAAQAGARTWFLMTWGRRDGDETNPELYPDYPTMQAMLAEGYSAYTAAASADGTPAWLVPAGLAWQQVYDDDADPTDPDGPFYRLYIDDGSHPSPRGTFLTACVIYTAQTGLAVDVTTAPVDGIEDAEYLAQVAAEVVLKGGGQYPWTGTGGGDTGTDTANDTAGDSAAPADDSAADASTEDGGCGCQSAPSPGGLLSLSSLLVLLGLRRGRG